MLKTPSSVVGGSYCCGRKGCDLRFYFIFVEIVEVDNLKNSNFEIYLIKIVSSANKNAAGLSHSLQMKQNR